MKKECIETLIQLTEKRIQEVIEYKKVWEDNSPQHEMIDKNLTHLQECINELYLLLNNLP
jgi:hypothetical protein